MVSLSYQKISLNRIEEKNGVSSEADDCGFQSLISSTNSPIMDILSNSPLINGSNFSFSEQNCTK